ncbi:MULTISPECIES: hypothetical protein [Pseudomonas]|uniref:Uncharacterized protein n=1 Tax=Pseudomonas chlororaphis subsp. aureofaciens TaxID=587851 RepID=A0AAD0ZH84_9PSED|nr:MULTISPECIES: hypothetical protein [Pseudomonas]AIC19341.1 hypothetical protein EY04_10680 [Pseudomonas chlororaphis]AZD91720.1 hypothetical protein C4K13_2303 [Pseudomonas chlororaphis subsp. aureofaciens]AZE29053.1 hypothetical protein C4K07_2268 [Pseudomonas chlororaphis subsp. aureofaciens]AZE35355.1 hypothetical protein C4K06_2322 [Pseudomonas chlororaphis subsp. aureofaciens]AZE41712.1 hypothetical protein C4K05_2372 [Pseudomonas chlororaphis subsp. aureofaciens]
MRLTRCLLYTGFCIVLAGLASLQATAGPSFDADRKGLEKLSANAGAELHRGLQKFHEMLMYLELQDTLHATEAKAAALEHFSESVVLFKKVTASAPERKILYQPRDDSEKEAIAAFQDRLKELDIAVPDTEKQLANLAVTVLTKHIHVLEKSSFKATKADYSPLRKTLRSQALLLDLGILTSIVWSLSADQPGGSG